MELRQLYYFTVCAQAGSFSRAAAALYTTQSNVSKVIHNLERELGFDLFERRQYGISLTQRGKQVYDYARTTLNSADKIRRYARSSQRSHLRILSNPDMWVSCAFCDYYREMRDPQTKYSFMTENTKIILEKMEEAEADLGFIYLTPEQRASLAGRFSKNHLVFAGLRTMPAMLYAGGGTGSVESAGGAAAADHEKDLTGAAEGLPAGPHSVELVQCGDEDFSILPSPGNDEQAGMDMEHYQVNVDTNNEMIIEELLRTTDLARISGELCDCVPGDHGQIRNTVAAQQLIFGCLTRNDRNLDPEAIRFLKFIREKVKISHQI